MILPVPSTKEGADISLVSMEGAEDLFKVLNEIYTPRARSMGLSKSKSRETFSLEVKKVGDYDVSIVPSLRDFDRLSDIFKVSENVSEILESNYSNGFSFVVAMLNKTGSFQPLAYTHEMPRDLKMFVPTRHEHGDDEEGLPDWDHTIYINSFADPTHHIKQEIDSVVFRDFREKPLQKLIEETSDIIPGLKKVRIPSDFESFFNSGRVSRIRVIGYNENSDLIIPCQKE